MNRFLSASRVIVRASVFCVLSTVPIGATAAESALAQARVAGLEARINDRELLVSFRLNGAFHQELRERLHSGIAVTFRHRVETIMRRPFFLVPNKLLGRTVVETQVEYDSLTRQYRLYRRTENKSKGKQPPFLDFEVRHRTRSLDEAVDWMTILRDVPLPWRPEFEPSERLQVRVNSKLGRHFIFLVIPSNYSPSAELRLEF